MSPLPTHLVFLDESGDHNLTIIDQQFPVFVLAATIFEYNYYLDVVNPKIDRLKYKYWGHRNVILHSSDIRKQRGKFQLLVNQSTRSSFLTDLGNLIDDLNFTIIAAGIDKNDFSSEYTTPESPYDLTLEFIMERLFFFFKNMGGGRTCALIAESRGSRENSDLKGVFDQLMQNGSGQRGRVGSTLVRGSEFQTYITDLKFLNKEVNESGNQMSDLVAYPIARKVIGRASGYYPYLQLRPKFYSRDDGNFWRYGLKLFPDSTDKRVQAEQD